MAFQDKPQIDLSAKNSNQSSVKLLEILNLQNGFICREDIPDYGCDFDIELIENGQEASNWRFALQLKSIVNPILVKDHTFISYPFETSRLGYLLRRNPGLGLIVLYDVSTSKLFFEYVEEIYGRLMNEKESDNWKSQEKVNIKVPVRNELNSTSVAEIHKIFLTRFQRSTLMHQSQAGKYNLPVVNVSNEFKYDFNNLDHVKRLLGEVGMSLLFAYDLHFIYELIIKVPYPQIYEDEKLLLIAAVAYNQVGMYHDSKFFIERLDKRYKLSTDNSLMIDFLRLNNCLALQDIDPDEFLIGLQNLLPLVIGQTNRVTLRLNIVYFELSKLKGLSTLPESLIYEIRCLFKDIKGLDEEEKIRCLLTTWNTENFSLWINNFRNERFLEAGMLDNMEVELPMEKRIARASEIISLHNEFYTVLDDLHKSAITTNDKLLQAYVIKVLVKFIIGFEIQQIAYEVPHEQSNENHRRYFLNKINHAGFAFQSFLELNRFNDAYLSLCGQIELLYISRRRYNYLDSFDLNALLKIKKDMEIQYEYLESELAIPKLMLKKQNKAKTDIAENTGMEYVKNLEIEQLKNLAKMIANSGKFPNAKENHIFNELNAYKLFHLRCDNPDVTILQKLPVKNTLAYTEPSLFILKSKATGIMSHENTDMDALLKSWGF